MATVNGTSGNDTLSGTAGDDTINGLGGSDLFLAGSTGGNDLIDGGTGFDSLEFRERATSAVVVDFVAGTISGGSSGTIRFANVERVVAGNFNDSLSGNGSSQTLTGYGGADSLWGAGGGDTLWGGAGADSFIFRETGTANADLINDFASGSDKILLDASVMSALGASGNFAAGDDRFVLNSAQDAEDRIIYNTTTRQIFYDADGSGSGAAVLIATLQSGATLAATDIVVEGGTVPGGGQPINGTPGNDSLAGGPGNDTINGFDGDDTVDGGAGADSMVGGAHADTYFVDNAGDVIVEFENGGFDIVHASVSYTLPAWVNHLTLTGTAAISGTGNELPNLITGNSGDNNLDGADGDDTLVGAAGRDNLFGGAGNDEMSGGEQDDYLNAGAGLDSLFGGAGRDFVELSTFGADSGDDTIDGGTDIDDMSYTGARSALIVDFAAGTITGGHAGGGGQKVFANIENFISGDHADRIVGGSAANVLQGGFGSDTVEGGAGNDTIYGGIAGNLSQHSETLSGGAGNDVLTGGSAADTFIFRETGTANADLINDFASGSDKILLDASVMSALGASGNFTAGDDRFVADAAGTAQDAEDRVIYNTTTRQIFYDADGSGSGGAVLIATLQSGATLAATDIVVEGGSAPGGGQAINGTSGNDSLTGTAGNDRIDGLAGDDSIDGGGGNDSVFGGAGFDVLVIAGTVDYGHDYLDGGENHDQLWFPHSALSAVTVDLRAGTLSGGGPGGTGSATLVSIETASGTRFGDHLVAADAGSFLSGYGGNDTLIGGNGNDNFTADGDGTQPAADDLVRGGGGNDFIWGGAGLDSLYGEAGDDQFNLQPTEAGDPRDFVDGGDGRDSIVFSNFPTSGLVVDLSAGSITASGGVHMVNATLVGIEDFSASTNGSHDRITGSAVGNRLSGSTGNDTLHGAGGNDTLSGGEGTDRFLFREAPGGGNADLITDFASGSDKLVLDGAAHANLGGSGNFAASDVRFFAAAGAVSGHDADDRVVYDTSTGSLYYDADGSGSGAAQLVATLQGAPTLVASDIVAGIDAPSDPSPYTVRTLLDNGASDNRVDIVFMGDGYTAAELGAYSTHINGLMAHMFDDSLLSQPFGRYESFFNIHAVDVISNQSGTDRPGALRDTALGGGYGSNGTLGADEFLAARVLNDALWGTGIDGEMRFIAINDPAGGGSAGSFATYSAGNTAAHHGTALHEAGHQFAGLGDHYLTTSQHYTGTEPPTPDLTADPTGAKWSHWLGYDQPGIGVIGVYEGAGYTTGIYRPSLDSKMRSTNNPFDAVGREAFILEFYELVDPLDAYLANTATLENQDEIWVDTIDADVILVDWIINGTTYANAGERISLSALGYAEGEFTVTARAYDPTDWVRVADRSSLEQTVQWRVTNDGTGTGNGGSTINGTSGNDSLVGGQGNDTINGFDGDDTIDGGTGSDSMVGGAHADTYFVDNSNDVIVEFEDGGFDTVNASATYTLPAWVNHLTLTGTAAINGTGNELPNRIIGNGAANTLIGRGGNDTIAGGGGNDFLVGDGVGAGVGADTFLFDVAPGEADAIGDFVSADDQLVLDGTVHANSGPSGLFAANDPRFWFSTTGLAHDPDDRVIYDTDSGGLWYDADGNAAGGRVLIVSLQGAPSLAAADIEIVNGSTTPPPGGQVINGTSGNDTLTGTAGSDTISGLGGNDLFLAGSTGGNDVIDGGTGYDSLEFRERATSAVVVDFGAGSISGGSSGTISFTNVERLVAGNFNDSLSGNASSQTLTGFGGSDTLWGAGGADTLWGSSGADTFVFRETGTANADRISDWASGSDTVALDNAAMSALGVDGDFVAGDARFASGAGFTSGRDTSDRVVFDTSTGRLYYDADGSGSGAAQLIATVQSGVTVAATDITVI